MFFFIHLKLRMHFTVITTVFRFMFSKSKGAKITSNKRNVIDHLTASQNKNVCRFNYYMKDVPL